MTEINQIFSRIKAKGQAAAQWARSLWLRKGQQAPVHPQDRARERRAKGRTPSYTKKGPGRKHNPGHPGCVKLRKRVSRAEGALANPFCPTGTDPDPKWLHATARDALAAGKAGL